MPLPFLLLAAAAAARPQAIPAAPDGNPQRWFSPADYPLDALIDRQQGVVGFELKVDPLGKPVSCRVYRSAGVKLLDDTTCKLAMERARFKQPRQRRIKRRRRGSTAFVVRAAAMPGYYRHSVRWRLPNLAGTNDQTFVVRSVIAPGGAIETCTITGVGGLGSGGSCGLFGSRPFLAAMLGANYARSARAEVRLDLTFADAPVNRQARGPDAYLLLAEAAVTFGTDGRLQGCTGIKALRSATKTTDLCALIRAQPPKIAAGAAGRRAVYTLDLSAYFR